MTVYKVQQPIMTSDPRGEWLIYDQARDSDFLMKDSLVPDDLRKMMNGRYKIYVEADIVEGEFIISHKVRERNW